MLKAIFALTLLRYPGLVRAIVTFNLAAGWSLLVINGFSRTATILLLLLSAASLAAILLIERYYVAVVLSLCFFHTGLIAYICAVGYALNTTPFYPAVLIDITLAGLLLGGLGATLTATWAILLLTLSEWATAAHWLPLPANYIPTPRSLFIFGFSINLTIILVVYAVVIFFAYVVRDALAQVGQQRDDLALSNATLRQKQQVEQQVNTSVAQVVTSLTAVAGQQLHSASQQVSAISQVTTTIEQLAQTARSIDETAMLVGVEAQQALDELAVSQQAVSDSAAAMLRIRSQVQQIVGRTIALNERIQQISVVVGTVSAIAAETHLLALNAAIEAAGAGAAGERFSVVAVQVKRLARRSQQEAHSIRELVLEVQRANAASVMATEQGLKDVDSGGQRTRAATDSTLAAIERVGQTTSRMQGIAMATQQQRSAASQSVVAMQQLKLAAAGVAASAGEIDMTVSTLSSMATQPRPADG